MVLGHLSVKTEKVRRTMRIQCLPAFLTQQPAFYSTADSVNDVQHYNTNALLAFSLNIWTVIKLKWRSTNTIAGFISIMPKQTYKQNCWYVCQMKHSWYSNVWTKPSAFSLERQLKYNLYRKVKARCNGDSLRAGKSSWRVDYQVSDLQQDSKVARFWTRGRAIPVSE